MKNYQDKIEFQQWLVVLTTHKVKSYLEIGSLFGKSWWGASLVLPKGARTVALDLPSISKRSHPQLIRHQKELINIGYDANLIIGDSRGPLQIAKVKALGPFDAIFIDGDHSYEGVKADWGNYGNLAPIVGFHDIARNKTEVPRFWNELKSSYRHAEFVSPGSVLGIGVLWH